jgi:hypothetical protein
MTKQKIKITNKKKNKNKKTQSPGLVAEEVVNEAEVGSRSKSICD